LSPEGVGPTLLTMIKAIVFDFDGVIVDTEPMHYRSTLRALAPYGVSFDYPKYLESYVGYDDRELLRNCLIELGGMQDVGNAQLSELIGKKAQLFEKEFNQDGVSTVAGALAFIDLAAAQWPLAIGSGASRRDIELILDQLGIADRFETTVSADDVPHSKPHPQTYAQAVDLLGAAHPELELKPGQCLAIEDTAAGLSSARGAGLMTLGLETTGPAKDLADAHRVIKDFEGLDIEQLRDWFDN
jgi:beta-phosphoglucomutase